MEFLSAPTHKGDHVRQFAGRHDRFGPGGRDVAVRDRCHGLSGQLRYHSRRRTPHGGAACLKADAHEHAAISRHRDARMHIRTGEGSADLGSRAPVLALDLALDDEALDLGQLVRGVGKPHRRSGLPGLACGVCLVGHVDRLDLSPALAQGRPVGSRAESQSPAIGQSRRRITRGTPAQADARATRGPRHWARGPADRGQPAHAADADATGFDRRARLRAVDAHLEGADAAPCAAVLDLHLVEAPGIQLRRDRVPTVDQLAIDDHPLAI